MCVIKISSSWGLNRLPRLLLTQKYLIGSLTNVRSLYPLIAIVMILLPIMQLQSNHSSHQMTPK